MSINANVKAQIRKNKSRVFRRAYIKRMERSGAFESEWLEITEDVKKFGKVTQSVDAERYAKLAFKSSTVVVNNSDGRYLDESDEHSLWFGYASQQRTLVRIEAGFESISLGADGIWDREVSPGAIWDVSLWDDFDLYDQRPIAFMGLLSGDMPLSAQYEVNLTVMPLLEIFRSFPASALTGFTSTGLTASQFCTLLRDQTDGSGNYIFRPFLGDTTTYWNIETTTNVYSQLNSAGSAELLNTNAWDVVQKLAEAEDFVAYITTEGQFNFKSRSANTSTAAYEFYGLGVPNREFGHTIKKINNYGRKYSKYYSRVSIQFRNEDTTTSFHVVESALAVSGINLPWIYGHKTLEITNLWIPGSTLATQIAENIFDNVTSVKKEIEFTTCFIPGLNALDRIYVSYDPATALPESLWDVNNWGDTTSSFEADALIWDASRGDSFYLNREEMNIISVETDLDKLENKIIARET